MKMGIASTHLKISSRTLLPISTLDDYEIRLQLCHSLMNELILFLMSFPLLCFHLKILIKLTECLILLNFILFIPLSLSHR